MYVKIFWYKNLDASEKMWKKNIVKKVMKTLMREIQFSFNRVLKIGSFCSGKICLKLGELKNIFDKDIFNKTRCPEKNNEELSTEEQLEK